MAQRHLNYMALAAACAAQPACCIPSILANALQAVIYMVLEFMHKGDLFSAIQKDRARELSWYKRYVPFWSAHAMLVDGTMLCSGFVLHELFHAMKLCINQILELLLTTYLQVLRCLGQAFPSLAGQAAKHLSSGHQQSNSILHINPVPQQDHQYKVFSLDQHKCTSHAVCSAQLANGHHRWQHLQTRAWLCPQRNSTSLPQAASVRVSTIRASMTGCVFAEADKSLWTWRMDCTTCIPNA